MVTVNLSKGGIELSKLSPMALTLAQPNRHPGLEPGSSFLLK